MTDKEALMELLRGAVFGAIIVGGTALFAFGVNVTNSEPAEKFKVVDHYGTCAVVRYRPENRAEDVYFLDCGNQHLNE